MFPSARHNIWTHSRICRYTCDALYHLLVIVIVIVIVMVIVIVIVVVCRDRDPADWMAASALFGRPSAASRGPVEGVLAPQGARPASPPHRRHNRPVASVH
jgi:hypothetical protein